MKLQLALLALLAVIANPLTAASSALWSGDYQPPPPPPPPDGCKPGFPDSNNFCYYPDTRPVEVGVKFTTLNPSLIAGVRIYRVDDNTVTGSLWKDGTQTPLTSGQFLPHTGHGWQDLVFASPVRIAPGTTYIASYFTSTAVYAFQHCFFTTGTLTVGPITALNSAYCYSGSSHLPTLTYLDSNYWVSPLWIYDFAGFFQPVTNAGYNTAKAGSAIPVKFSLSGDYGVHILKTDFPKVTLVSCTSGAPIGTTPSVSFAASTSGLTYDATAGQYAYVWKTDKAWAGQCAQFDLGLNDDSSHTFNVQFK